MGKRTFTSMYSYIAAVIFVFFSSASLHAQNTIVPFGSVWKYLDDGSNQGTEWQEIAFNDGSWKSGPGKLGYGETDLATVVSFGPDPNFKHITTYFRKTVSISDASAFTSYTASLMRDDGAIVYINGKEVYRSNLPDGTVDYATRGSSASDDGKTAQVFTINASSFVSGNNVIAVEIHQSGRATSDKSFDLKLDANGATADRTAPNVLSINRQSPSSSTTAATSVTFRATFSEGVTGVDAADFTLTTVSGAVSGTLGSGAVTAVGTDGVTYDITVSSITNEGVLRLDLIKTTTGIKDKAGNELTGSFTAGQTYTIDSEKQAEGFFSTTALAPLPIHKNIGDQPQSKVWKYDGKWWAVVPAPSEGTYLWRLDHLSWTKVLKISSASSTQSDCKVVGNIAHIFLFRGGSNPSELISIEYVPSAATYKLWSMRSSKISLTLDPEVETAVIEIDTKGRMWVVYDSSYDIKVKWSDAPYSTWSAPITVATGIKDDDIGAIIAMPTVGKIGVLWSDQTRKRFGFRMHTDGAGPTVWSVDEVPASQSAIESGAGMADDHLNMAIARDGTLYCAVKTGYKSGFPTIALLVRRPSGVWDDLHEVSGSGNRPIVILNEAAGRVKVVYAAKNAGGIFYKESSTSNISFGSEIALISETCDYATSAKDNYSSDVVILASTNTMAYGVLGTDAPSTILAAKADPNGKDLKNLYAFPNPFADKVTVKYTANEDGEYSLFLCDSRGAQISALGQGIATAGEVQLIDVDGAALPAGLYFVRLETKSGSKNFRLMLNR